MQRVWLTSKLHIKMKKDGRQEAGRPGPVRWAGLLLSCFDFFLLFPPWGLVPTTAFAMPLGHCNKTSAQQGVCTSPAHILRVSELSLKFTLCDECQSQSQRHLPRPSTFPLLLTFVLSSAQRGDASSLRPHSKTWWALCPSYSCFHMTWLLPPGPVAHFWHSSSTKALGWSSPDMVMTVSLSKAPGRVWSTV